LEGCINKISARIDVECEEGRLTLSVFSPVIEEICGGTCGEVTIESILSCDRFDATCSEKNVIVSVSRD